MLLSGQTVNIGGKIDAIGGSFNRGVVTSLALNSTDQIIALSADFTTTEFRWFWYRTQRNAAMTAFTTTLVAARNATTVLPYPIELKMARNSNSVVQVYVIDKAIWVQPISMSNPAAVLPIWSAVSDTFMDRSLEVLSHTDDSFSLLFGVDNQTETCIYHMKITETSATSTPQRLYCPYTTFVLRTYLRAWSDPSDTSIFYITASHATDNFNTYKCTNALVGGAVSCSQLTTTTIVQTPMFAVGRRARNSNVFFYAFTGSGNPVQVVATDYVAGVSSIMSVPLSSSRRTIGLVESITPNAVSLLAYDLASPGFTVYDLIMNATTKQVSYTTVTSMTNNNLLQPLDNSAFPAVSFGPSIYSIGSTSQGTASQASVQYFARKYCGDSLLAAGEQCDSVPYCDTTTCQCSFGSSGPNVCNALASPVAPIAPPVAAPVDTPPTSTPVSSPVVAPAQEPMAVPGQQPTGPIGVPVQPTVAPAGNGTGIVGDPKDAGGNIATIVPAVVVPVSVAAAGVVVLVVLLQRRKKKKQSEKPSSSADPEDPAATSEKIKMEPVNVSLKN